MTHDSHKYIDDIEEREEGGTPAIVESIRAGLVFQLKEVCQTFFKKVIEIPALNLKIQQTCHPFQNSEVHEMIIHHFDLNALYILKFPKFEFKSTWFRNRQQI